MLPPPTLKSESSELSGSDPEASARWVQRGRWDREELAAGRCESEVAGGGWRSERQASRVRGSIGGWAHWQGPQMRT